MLNKITIISLIAGCTVANAIDGADEGLTPSIGVIQECDFVAQVGDPLVDVSYHFEICTATEDEASRFQWDWILNTCLPQLGPGGRCGGNGCIVHNANPCWLND